ncbi:MAG: glycosyltransferase [Nanoarchaeota archaeon]|nr:glycosyltransferase [Nanoarchaeota archaeon]
MIVSDNFSTDNTRKIAEKYGCRIIDGGNPAEGRHNGALAAKHDILFLDADVVLPVDFLGAFISRIKKHKLDLATCRIKPLSNKLKHKPFYFLKNMCILVQQKINPHVHGQCFFSTKKIFVKINGFNKYLKHAEEHDYMFRAAKLGKFRVYPDLFVYCSPRRMDRDGSIGIIFRSLYPEIVRYFKKELYTELVEHKYEWNDFNEISTKENP